MVPRSLQQIARDCGGTVEGGSAETVVRRVCTDSRAVQAGDLFVALRGERFDGHDFLPEVAGRGAAAVLMDRPAAGLSFSLPSVVVDDTRAALGRFAGAYRQEFQPRMIAVGGSNGKTTTKELLASILKQHFKTLWSEASFNNDIGVPLTLLRLLPEHEVAVLEVGTNHPGELRPLLDWVRPSLGVITNLGREHLEFFDDMDGVCREEGVLAEQLPADGCLYLGADDEWADAILRRTRATVVRVGRSEACAWRVHDIQLSLRGTTFQVHSPVADYAGTYHTVLVGRHHAVNALMAIAVGSRLGLSRAAIERGLEAVPPAPHRMEQRMCGGVQVLDDCYNANADSVAAALETLAELPCDGARVAVLGEMAELGRHAQSAHAEAGRKAAQCNISQLLVVGRWARITASAARQAGLHRVLEFEKVDALRANLRKLIRPGDLVLLKASRRMQLELLLDVLREGEPRRTG